MIDEELPLAVEDLLWRHYLAIKVNFSEVEVIVFDEVPTKRYTTWHLELVVILLKHLVEDSSNIER